MAISCRCGPPRPSGQGMTDTLLEWMSFRESGRRSDLPDELLSGERALRILSDLSALGHAEVQPDGAWRVPPQCWPSLRAAKLMPAGSFSAVRERPSCSQD